MTSALHEDVCPVPLELLGTVYRADAEELATILDALAEPTRAQLAVYLYGRSHTHALGLKIAAGCAQWALRHASGLIGMALYEQSRRHQPEPGFGSGRLLPAKRISLGGSMARSGAFA